MKRNAPDGVTIDMGLCWRRQPTPARMPRARFVATDLEPAGRPPGLILQETSLQDAWEHCLSTPDREQGGLLLGNCFVDDDRVFAAAWRSLPAPSVRSTPVGLTFTHDSWAAMFEQIPPGEAIVGWYHSHPGLGVFLSERDLFIHRHFFELQWQVALVLDPSNREVGLFQWSGDAVAPADGYFVAPDLGPLRTGTGG